MTNTTDYYQPEHQTLALSPATATVLVNGALCEDLEPIEIVRGGWPDFGRAKLTYNPAARQDEDMIDPERTEDRFGMGSCISIRQAYNSTPPEVSVASLPLFVGHIEHIGTTLTLDRETVEITAKDLSAVLQRITAYGRRVSHNDGSTVFLPGLDTIFNPNGRPNAAIQPVTLEGKTFFAFSASDGEAAPWSCADVIVYLLSEHLPAGQLHWPQLEQLLALTDGQAVNDLDVTGLSLLEALHRCCETAGITFHFVPRLAEIGPSQAIVFHRNGQSRCVELNCQPKGRQLSVSRTSIHAMRSYRNFYPVTHRYIGQGDFKMHEATFELVKAWDPAMEETDYYKFSPSTNPEFCKVKDVYRKWCLNEAGDYTGQPYNQGDPYDFSAVFEGNGHVQRRRRFWPALSTSAYGQSLGYHLGVSYDDGLNWWPYLYAFNNLLDECGVWLSSDQIDVDTWVAALKDGLKFRLTASIVSDDRLTSIVADGPVGSVAPIVDHVLTLPRRFRYRKVSSGSIFYQTNREGFGTPDEADDSEALHAFVRQRSAISAPVIETTNVKTATLCLHFQPGDRVTSSPESRDLLSCRRDNRSCVWIERVHMDFRNQCTNLQLVRQRL